MRALGDSIDNLVMMIFIAIGSLLLNSGALIMFDTRPVTYTADLWSNLFVISVCSTIGMVLANEMYQFFKVSWSIIILNL
jgi:hypothetical protein